MQSPIPKLSIELVPETCWFSNVRSNVSQDEWNFLRRRTYREAGYRCKVCGGRGPEHPVECHEIWHYDDLKRIQKLEGLTALCPDCHQVKHFGLANIKGRSQQALAHLSKVNAWDQIQARNYVDEQFKVWQKRSQLDWSLDISWLKQFGIEIPARVPDRRHAPGLEINEVYLPDSLEWPDSIEAQIKSTPERNNEKLWWWLLGVSIIIAALRAAYYLLLQPND